VAPIAPVRLVRVALLAFAGIVLACEAGPPATPAITPGTPTQPRVVVIVAKDFTYAPPVVDLVPGETVVLQVINGGLTLHEAVIGGQGVQDAWEAADTAYASAPPGAQPQVSVAPEHGGLRILVRSGERVDVTWTVPADAATDGAAWFVGCHIPGHWSQGMVVPVRFVGPGGVPLGAGGALAGARGVPSGSASAGGSVVP
jgi:FtsP/CotA-like multicopper oxidase with cupredoxin domain